MASRADSATPSEPLRLLIVDDEVALLHTLAANLSFEGFEVATAENASEALEIIAKQTFSVVLTDARMPSMNGFELCASLRKTHPDLPVLVMTADPPEQVEAERRAAGARAILSKPFAIEALAQTLRETVLFRP